MTIRYANEQDEDVLYDMARSFKEASGYDFLPTDEGRVRETIKTLLRAPKELYAVIVYEHEGTVVGMIAGCISPSLFSDARVAGELSFWVNPENRSSSIGAQLHSAFELWAKTVGCSACNLVLLEDDNLESIDKFYRNLGYRPVERSYIKELK